MSGTKHDGGKPDWSLLPKAAVEDIIKVLMFGANKYDRNNYRAGFNSNRLVAAAMRHITSWNDGEDNDTESGLSHLAHAGCCIIMLLQNIKEEKCDDGRYKRP